MNLRITTDKIDIIMFPEILSPLQQEFKSWHDKLSQFDPECMFRLAKL